MESSTGRPFDASPQPGQTKKMPGAFFYRVPVDAKEFLVYAGGYHEPHHDIDAGRVVRDVERWLGRHAECMC